MISYFIELILAENSHESRGKIIIYLLTCAFLSNDTYCNYELVEIIIEVLQSPDISQLRQTMEYVETQHPQLIQTLFNLFVDLSFLNKEEKVSSMIPPMKRYWKELSEIEGKCKAIPTSISTNSRNEHENKTLDIIAKTNHLNIQLMRYKGNILHQIQRTKEMSYLFPGQVDIQQAIISYYLRAE